MKIVLIWLFLTVSLAKKWEGWQWRGKAGQPSQQASTDNNEQALPEDGGDKADTTQARDSPWERAVFRMRHGHPHSGGDTTNEAAPLPEVEVNGMAAEQGDGPTSRGWNHGHSAWGHFMRDHGHRHGGDSGAEGAKQGTNNNGLGENPAEGTQDTTNGGDNSQ
eukprot:TRINITY_DN119_c0_g1_i5.p1 TRINITY_DN119_c0_g1~~TRINITY_DN119_c0_g1_i5.p1  ORF type:complete len:163 (+),score=13.79 TRINITY_DN119_c0_g1_i5:47-535(+)